MRGPARALCSTVFPSSAIVWMVLPVLIPGCAASWTHLVGRESWSGRTDGGLRYRRRQIRDYFKGHKSGDEIERALKVLEQQSLARCQPEKTQGRSAERWYTIGDQSDRSDQSKCRSPFYDLLNKAG